jgi:hypothetical protein
MKFIIVTTDNMRDHRMVDDYSGFFMPTDFK